MKIDMDEVERLVRGNLVTEMQIYLTPIAQQIDDWAEQNREYYKTATRRKELLQDINEALQLDPDCPFCGLMTWDDDSEKWVHAADCDLAKELRDSRLARELADD